MVALVLDRFVELGDSRLAPWDHQEPKPDSGAVAAVGVDVLPYVCPLPSFSFSELMLIHYGGVGTFNGNQHGGPTPDLIIGAMQEIQTWCFGIYIVQDIVSVLTNFVVPAVPKRCL